MELDTLDLGTSKRKRSPPSSLLLQTNRTAVPESSDATSLLSYRLPSPSIHWDSDTMTTSCQVRACEINSIVPKPVLASKRSFTADYLANLRFQLNGEPLSRQSSVARSLSSSARTITPVPSLAFSQTSCSTAVELDQSPSSTESQRHKLEDVLPQMAPKHAESLPLPVERIQTLERLKRKPVRCNKSHAASPSLSTFKYEQYEQASCQKDKVRTERPLPPLPVDEQVTQWASEVSFIDWDSDDGEDECTTQLSRVNAMLKRSLADLRPSSRNGQTLQIQRKEYGSIKFGLSVVMEDPSISRAPSSSRSMQSPPPPAPLTTTSSAALKRLAKRNVTSPGPYTGTRRFSSKSATTNQRSTIVGYENLRQSFDQRDVLDAKKQQSPEPAEPEGQIDPTAHKDKRRRLSKLSQWVKRRVSSSSK